MSYTYRFPRPAVSCDCVVFRLNPNGKLELLLVQRGNPPYAGDWALPGGFVEPTEGLQQAAERELHEETGIRAQHWQQVAAFGDVDRDPRTRVITIAWYALAEMVDPEPVAASDAAAAGWAGLTELPVLAFDHSRIIELARRQFARDLMRS